MAALLWFAVLFTSLALPRVSYAASGTTALDPYASATHTNTLSYSVTAGNSRAMVVYVSDNDSINVSSVTWNGLPLTRAIQQADVGSNAVDSIWYLVLGNSSSTITANIVVVTDGAGDGVAAFIAAEAYSKVNQTFPVGSEQSYVGAPNPSITVVSASGDLAIDLVGMNSAGSPTQTATAGQTLLGNSPVSTTYEYSTSTKPGAASVPMSWTVNGLTPIIQVGLNLRGASSASPVPPTVILPTSAALSTTTATLGGDVSSDGGSAITARGVLYVPTATNSNPQLGGTGVTNATTAGTTGIFVVNVTGLSSGVPYSFVAYATNAGGTTYTSPVSAFTPLGAAAAPTVISPTVANNTTGISATLGGNVISDGGSPISVIGVVYAPTATNSNPQLLGTGVAFATTVGTTGVFTVGVPQGIFPALTLGTQYSYAAYATNGIGTSYSSVGTFTATDTNLLTLSISPGALSPVFDPNTLNYTVALPAATTSLTFTPTLPPSTSSVSMQVDAGAPFTPTFAPGYTVTGLTPGPHHVYLTIVDGTGHSSLYTFTIIVGIPTVWVDSTFTTPGAVIAVVDPLTHLSANAIVGVTGFSTIAAAVAAVDTGGSVDVNAATYTEDVSTGVKGLTLVGSNGLNSVPGIGTGLVNISGNFTLASGDTLLVALNGTVAGTSYGQWSVSGTVTLGSAALSYSGSDVPATGQFFDLVQNTGGSPISGIFSGEAEAAVISSFLGSSLSAQVSYLGGGGQDAVISVLGTYVTPGGQLVISNPPGGGGNADLTITLIGGGTTIQIYDPLNLIYAGAGAVQVDPHTITVLLSSVTSGLVFNGTPGNDSYTIDFSTGNPIPTGGMTVNGGTQTGAPGDVMHVVGVSGLHAVYTPDAVTNGNGVIVFTGTYAGTVTFTGLEPVDFVGGSVTLTPPSATNNIDVANGFLVDGTTPALVISGTSGGVGFEQLNVRGAAVTIDTSGLGVSTDQITITSANNAHTNTSLTIITGTDAGDYIHVNGSVAIAGSLSLNATTVTVAASQSVAASGAIGTITIGADALTIAGTATLNAAVSATFKQNSNGTLIDLGGANAAGTLGLSNAELGVVTTPTLNIGDVNSGAITVSASITRSSATALNLTTGSTIALNNLLNSAGGNVTLNGTTIPPAATGTDVSMGATGTLAFGSGDNLGIAIGGTTVDTGYTQLNVAGFVNLTGAVLSLSGAYVPTPTDTFTIVNNDGVDAITGTFTGLADGSTFVFNGAILEIHYNGGTGNDVVLSVPPVISSVTPPANGTYNDSDVMTFTANFSKVVTVNTGGGVPYIAINIGGTVRHAVYVSGSGTANLVFQYTVTTVDLDSDGIAVTSPIVLNGGTIQDSLANNASLSFNPPVTTSVLVDGRVFSTAGPSSNTAPGTIAGGASVGTWDSIRSGMVIAPNGALAYRAFLTLGGSVTALNYQGIWKSPDGTFASTYLLARTGSAAPGTTSALFDLLPLNPYIDNLGQNTFVGFLRVGTGTPVTDSTNDSGIWSEQATAGTGPRLLLRQGDAVTGGTVTMVAPSGWAGVSLPATTSTTAYTAFNVQLNGNTSTPSSALVRVTSTSAAVTPTVLATQGDAAPGIGAATGGTFDTMYGNSNDPRMDGAGDVAFLAYLVDGRSGIWYDNVAGTLSAVARTGEATPGLVDTFTGFERPSLASGGGHIAFRAFMTTTGQGVWSGDPATPGGLVAIAKTGDTALPGIPGGSQLNSVWSPFSNASGKVAFRVSLLDGASVETRAIVTDANGTLGVIAKAGDAAPGTADTFVNFDHPIIGDGNQAAFSATTLGGTTGIWKQAAGGGALSLALKVGDTITGNGVTRTVGAFIVIGTASSDRLNEVVSMNAAGQILVWISYTNGDTGMLLTVP